ncbi:hypothetical protein ACLB2K_006672 [Fragaria x ananassa]
MMQHLRSRVSALFAISVSDLALINMWCHDICREQAANKPASPKDCVPSAQQISRVIKDNRDLDLPAHKVMVATFEEAVDKALDARDAFSVAACNCSESFMAQFDEGCADGVIQQVDWDTSKVRDKLKRDMEAHIASVSAASYLHDSDLMPRVWTGKEDIRAITKTARSVSLNLLSVMAAIRLDDHDTDNIEKTLFLALVNAKNAAAKDRSITTVDPLASSTWQEVSSSKTLIRPVQ